MTSTHDVLIIGGGAIGAACARELAAAGREVLVLEPGGAAGQAWRAAGGMLAAQIEANVDHPLFRLCLAGRDHYAKLAASLWQTTALDVGLRQEGIAQVARGEAEAAELRARAISQRADGQATEWLDGAEVRGRWPSLEAPYGAFWAPEDGAIDPTALVRALLADAARLGARVVADAALALERRGDQVRGAVGRRGRYSARDVVLAAGAWSARLAGLPRSLPVEPVRGQMVALPWPENMPSAIVYRGDCYILPRGNEAIAGSTMEYVGFRTETTPAGLTRILTAATEICPRLNPRSLLRAWAGLRPMTPDALPIIGPDPRLRGLWYATGHGRNGILLAGITGVLIRQLLCDESPRLEWQAFSPERFQEEHGAESPATRSPRAVEQ